MSMANITHVVVHYSATYEDQNLTRADIDRMHKARGWKMVGYHYVIRRDGTVEIGRPETMVGAHVGGQNTGKIGICCIGGLNRATGPNVGVDNRTPEQIESLVKLIRDIRKRHPRVEVVGHRDLAATQCPGFDVRVWWAKVQKQAAPAPTPVAPDAPVRTIEPPKPVPAPTPAPTPQPAPAAKPEPKRALPAILAIGIALIAAVVAYFTKG